VSGGYLHLLVNGGSPYIKRATEMYGKPNTLFTWLG
jgi:hypothetical protein